MLWGKGLVEETLGVSSHTAARILRQLESEGYVTKIALKGGDKRWQPTLKGNALSLASAARPISRRRAEKTLGEFIERVKEVNCNDYFLYKVETVVVFGSYLSTTETINDLDIAVKLVPKLRDADAFRTNAQNRISQAWKEGRRFSNTFEELAWPQIEVLRYLKSRSRIISLHETSDGVLDKCQSLVVYQEV